MGFCIGGGAVLGFQLEKWKCGGKGRGFTQPRVCMRDHQIFVASSRDVAGRIMHSEDSVEDAIFGDLRSCDVSIGR